MSCKTKIEFVLAGVLRIALASINRGAAFIRELVVHKCAGRESHLMTYISHAIASRAQAEVGQQSERRTNLHKYKLGNQNRDGVQRYVTFVF